MNIYFIDEEGHKEIKSSVKEILKEVKNEKDLTQKSQLEKEKKFEEITWRKLLETQIYRLISKGNDSKSIEKFLKDTDFNFHTDFRDDLTFFAACKILGLKPKSKKVKKWYAKMEKYLNT